MVDTRMIRELLGQPELLHAYLEGLTNSQFRQASRMLGETLLADTDAATFWSVFRILFLADRKAFLGTLLKALSMRVESGGASALWTESFVQICSELNETDRKKVLLSILPLLSHPDDADRLFVQCGMTEPGERIPYLLQIPTPPCRFLLLRALRYVEHDRSLLIRTCHFLMKKGDGPHFNLASLIRLSFGLEEVRGTFSLSLEPYQLSRIEQNFDAFLHAIG